MNSLNRNKLVSTIRSATEEVFTTMLGISVQAQPAVVEQPGSQPYDGVIGLVGLAGSWVGAGRISCSTALACRLSGALLASEYTAVNEDVLDAMAEMTNMVIGSVKSTLEEELGPMGLSIPTVIFGRNYQTRSFGVQEWTLVPFECEGERFEVRFALMPNSKAPNSGEANRHLVLQGVG